MTLLVAGLLSLPAVATWANWAADTGTGGVYRANNEHHWFAYGPTAGPDIVNAFEAARTQDFEPTTLITSNHGTGIGDNDLWDVYVQKCYGCPEDEDAVAYAKCENTFYRSSTGEVLCSHWHVWVNGVYTDDYNAWWMRVVGCHETGHTVGLTHQSSGDSNFYACMMADTNLITRNDLGNHNTFHINNYY